MVAELCLFKWLHLVNKKVETEHSIYVGTVYKIWSESLSQGYFSMSAELLCRWVCLISKPQSGNSWWWLVGCNPENILQTIVSLYWYFLFEHNFHLQLTVAWCFVFVVWLHQCSVSPWTFKIFRIKVFKYPRKINNVFQCILKLPLALRILLTFYLFLKIVKRNIIGKRNEQASK